MTGEESLVSVTTKYTEDEYIKFNKFHMFRKDKKIVKYLILNIIFLICVILYFVLEDYFLAFIMSVFIAAFDIAVLYVPKRACKKIIKSDKLFGKLENKISFFSDGVKVENEKSNLHLKYEDFNKCYLVKNNFYLYLNKASAILILEKDITADDIKKIENILKEKMGNNFEIIN